MTKIRFEEDAAAIRRYLDSRVHEFIALATPISAIEVGYEVSQAGWVYIHADRREQHQRDGEWTSSLDDEPLLEMSHWVEADPEEVGRFLLEIIQTARADGLFSTLKRSGSIQLDIEDFDGSWAWPTFAELGKSNLA